MLPLSPHTSYSVSEGGTPFYRPCQPITLSTARICKCEENRFTTEHTNTVETAIANAPCIPGPIFIVWRIFVMPADNRPNINRKIISVKIFLTQPPFQFKKRKCSANHISYQTPGIVIISASLSQRAKAEFYTNVQQSDKEKRLQTLPQRVLSSPK